MTESKVQTNMELTPEERMALKMASGDPFSHDAIVGGVRALIDDWRERGTPQLLMLTDPQPEPAVEL